MNKSKLLIITAIAIAIVVNPVQTNAQRKKKGAAPAKKEAIAPVKDSTKKETPKGPLSIEKFLKKDVKTMKGMTTVYNQGGKYFININDTLIGRDIIMVTRVSKSAMGIRKDFSGYAGDDINSSMFRFEKGPNNKIFLKEYSTRERSKDSTCSMFRNLENSNFAPIAASFDIKAQSVDKKDNVIDITDFISSDNGYLYFDKRGKKAFGLGNIEKDKSYIVSVKTYPINTEFRTVKTFAKSSEGSASYEFNVSFVLLPKEPMLGRYQDERVGYFTNRFVDFDANPQGVKKISVITRWRLEPKPEDLEKYKRGELVEPAKPIVFYIDPTTPKEWVPYLIQGVNDWEPAFRKAGFKNAICAKPAPTFEEDSTWSLEDARYSAIVYKPSDIANASGPHVHDPRSGEIIESHVNWYHNVMSLLRNWYFIQCSPVDPAARKMVFDHELMGQLVRFVSSHEVGHTLGLRHNFAGTAFFTAAQLRDTAFLRANGHTTSIMDYSRFNYVAQPGDNIPQELLFPRINSYDEWAIEWGYRRFYEFNDPDKELPMINKWTIEKIKDNKYFFGTESSQSDPRYQSEDLGENQMETNELGIKNLKFIMDSLLVWTSTPYEDYEDLKTLHGEIVSQYIRYINHVSKWVGGVYETPKTVEQEGDVYVHVPKARQIEAMNFLKKNLYTPPTWLIPEDVMNKIVSRGDLTLMTLYRKTFERLLSKKVLLSMNDDEFYNGKKAYTINNFFTDLNGSVWASLYAGNNPDVYTRIMQKSYVDALIDLYTGDASSMMGRIVNPVKDYSDIVSSLYYQLSDLQKKLKNAKTTDSTVKAHYAFLNDRIEKVLKRELGAAKS